MSGASIYIFEGDSVILRYPGWELVITIPVLLSSEISESIKLRLNKKTLGDNDSSLPNPKMVPPGEKSYLHKWRKQRERFTKPLFAFLAELLGLSRDADVHGTKSG